MHNKTTKHPHNKGFTLVELAIVLVVIGIMVGGLMVGKDMIYAAKLREIPSQAYDYIAQVQAFREKYNALPGDMPNAVQIWGSAADGTYTNGCNTDEIQIAWRADPITATCNGTGNAKIGYWSSHRINNLGNVQTYYFEELAERLRLWQHLYNAGMIKQQLRGARLVAEINERHKATPEVNIPSGPFNNSGYHMLYEDELDEEDRIATNIYSDLIQHRHILVFGGNNGTNEPFRAVLPPKDAFEIDKKLDDGLPNKGKIVTFQGNPSFATHCTGTSGADIVYRKDRATLQPAVGCSLIFITGY
jgi:prepilin-type N-terminal cleavage/methylation domain-containing protein